MQKFITAACLCIIFLNACHNSADKKVDAPKIVEEPQLFFPVTDFILGQLTITESLPVTPLKITTNGKRLDSLWLKREDIRKFAAPFLHPVIDSISMHNFFSEKSFMDQTINAITFSYDPKVKLPDSLKLNHWDVYIDPQKQDIQRIYLVKEELLNKVSVTTQLTWKEDKWCSIRTIKQPPGKDPEVTEELVKWNFDQ